MSIMAHLHSNLSDGLLTRYDICLLAGQTHILCFCDHNILPSPREEAALQAAFPHKEFPLCTEISCRYQDGARLREVHVLGFGLTRSVELEEFLARHHLSEEASCAYVTEIIRQLHRLGIPFQGDFHTLRAIYPRPAHITRGKVAGEMIRQGLVPNRDAAYDLIGDDGPAYVEKTLSHFHTLEETLDIIRRHNGCAVLAHPFSSKISDVAALAAQFARCGGMALELNAKEPQRHPEVRALAQRLGLVLTYGNDFHRPGDPFLSHPADFYHDLMARRPAL